MADRSALATRAVASSAAAKYERHRPEDTLLYKTIQAHWRTFLAEVSGGAEPELPRFVLEEVEAFLKCGILAHGFLRVVCDECHDNRLVAFSCCPQRETMESSTRDLPCLVDPPRNSLQIVCYPKATR